MELEKERLITLGGMVAKMAKEMVSEADRAKNKLLESGEFITELERDALEKAFTAMNKCTEIAVLYRSFLMYLTERDEMEVEMREQFEASFTEMLEAAGV